MSERWRPFDLTDNKETTQSEIERRLINRVRIEREKGKYKAPKIIYETDKRKKS